MNKSLSNAQLQLELTEDENTILIRLQGKSILRDPNEFIMPVLQETIEDAGNQKKRIIIDFTDLVYMNSSTLTPIIKILEKIRMGDGKITLKYKKSLKWQDISFSALVIFQTSDNRIEIKGV
jgi:anti-anti-sigma regulatory factor